MATDISICNLALSHIGRGMINAFDERSAEARACNTFYDHARQTLLARSMWTFARKRAALAEITNDYVERWAHAYAEPGDSKGVLYLIGERDPVNNPIPVEFEVKNGKVYANVSPAYVDYKIDITDPSKFSDLFVDALSYHLASYLARPLTKSAKLVQEMQQATITALSLAVTDDAAQDVTYYAFDPDSIVIRG